MLKRSNIIGLLIGILPLIACAAHAEPSMPTISRQESVELDRLVSDVCRRDIVLLGEDADHGSGRTLEIKAELVKRLVSRCGFGGIVFESSIYEALELERRLAAGDATEDDVVSAAGQLWFWAQEAQPLSAFLLQNARDGRLRIGGMDMQPTALPGRYAGTRLGADVASVLDDPARRTLCADDIQRHARWRYDDNNPFDDAARVRLRTCIDDMQAAVAAAPARASAQVARDIVGLNQYMAMADTGDQNARDRAMFDNLMWYRERWPKRTRIIVWCATAHAAKALTGASDDRRPLGSDVHERFGDRAAVIGFSALVGRFGGVGGRGRIFDLSPAPADSLDARVLADESVRLRYLDRKRLAKYGTIASRAVTYRKWHALRWTDVIDGLIVLREEHPTTPVGE